MIAFTRSASKRDWASARLALPIAARCSVDVASSESSRGRRVGLRHNRKVFRLAVRNVTSQHEAVGNGNDIYEFGSARSCREANV